ncbi:MAG: type III-A CRISPR-associated RAMP protein Csm3 [Thermodesulfobacteria bacterium]|nr:type III-A CRISPR-associated RAMP protein Csm3 [Thermodesulfobacteriota bacterium]
MKLVNIKEIKGKIKLLTGLHIGAGDTEMRIGGTDNPVIKHPVTNEPYIPGSSLKGKIRTLLELRSGLLVKAETNGKPLSAKALQKLDGEEKREALRILKLFGTSGAEAEEEVGPTRVAFSDCFITEECRKEVKEGKKVLTEVKAENTINRIKGTAEHPRFIERVPAGIEFEFRVTLKEFEEDKDLNLEELLLEGMKLLEMDSLGGCGSRGYGKIKFELEGEWAEKFEKINPFKK